MKIKLRDLPFVIAAPILFAIVLAITDLNYTSNKTTHQNTRFSEFKDARHLKMTTRNPDDQNTRQPAMSFNDYDLSMYSDYFITEKHKKEIRYNLSVDFWTDKDEQYIKNQSKKSAQDAFRETFIQLSVTNPELKKSFGELFKKNLFNSFLNNFIKNLKFLKIIDGNFYIQLNFSPEQDGHKNFKQEFSSNQLISQDNTGNLYHYLTSEKPLLTNKILKLDLSDENNQELNTGYQYVGGTILLSFEILDISWDITKPVPEPKKNALKGNVHLRRYFKINTNQDISFSGNQDIKLLRARIEADQNVKAPYLTVDIIKNFNLENIIPEKNKAIIHFGKLLDNYQSKRTIVNNTGKLKLYGEIKNNQDTYQFTTEIKKLIYNFEKNQFDQDSELLTRLKLNGKKINSRSPFSIILSKQIKNNILNQNAKQLIEKLNLKRFHKDIKASGKSL